MLAGSAGVPRAQRRRKQRRKHSSGTGTAAAYAQLQLLKCWESVGWAVSSGAAADKTLSVLSVTDKPLGRPVGTSN
jgi:hypothetical protein